MSEYKVLQNGSDIRGIVSSENPNEKVNLSTEQVYRITKGFALWLSNNTGKPFHELSIAVGHDSRLSADELSDTIFKTLLPLGIKVYNANLASTPAMFMSTVFKEFNCDGSIMITASHLPSNRNGFKYFSKSGGLDKKDITEILSYAESDNIMDAMFPVSSLKNNALVNCDLMHVYAEHLKNIIKQNVNSKSNFDRPLEGLKIMIDAGNGAGGFYAKEVLSPLGADISASQFLEPNGSFPNHIPNPENVDAMRIACERVIETNSDLGIIFDTDVDRASAIDANGNPIGRDSIVALAAALIAPEHPHTTVVTDSITGDGLTMFLENCLGLKHLRFKRGYRNVINKSVELNENGIDSQLAIETSGHAAYKENFFLDDGAYLATKIIIKAMQLKNCNDTISSLIAPLIKPNDEVEKRFPIKNRNFIDYGNQIIEDLKLWVLNSSNRNSNVKISLVTPNYEGVRIKFEGQTLEGWCLLRLSLHDPIIPLNIQTSVGKCDDILNLLMDFFDNYELLETE